LIATLFTTIIVEGAVVIGYSVRQKKPVVSLLITSVIGNLITQALLWMALRFFFQYYVETLLITESLIWLVEGVLLYGLRFNRLNMREAFSLSLIMNLSSFVMGWFLPI